MASVMTNDPNVFDSDELLSDVDLKERDFHANVREVVVIAIVGIFLYIGSFVLLGLLRRERDEEFLPYTLEDMWVYKISLWCCSFSMAVSVGAALLLPISTISNEVLVRYPKSWYMRWLNASLIHGIWNLIFMLSNVSLFLFLPFAYLFCESEGFTGAKRGLVSRAKETIVTLLLLSVVVLGMMYILAAFIDRDQATIDQLFNLYSYYLPFLYSCVSFLGVLLLLICTPLGFARLFTIVGDLVIKPQFMRDLQEDYNVALFEEESLRKRVKAEKRGGNKLVDLLPVTADDGRRLQNGQVLEYLEIQLAKAEVNREVVYRASKSAWRRRLGWPLAMLVLILLTGISLYLVGINVMLLLSGWRSLPTAKGQDHRFDLGISSLSALGALGVGIEVVIIGYLLVTSIVGLYSIPTFRKILPKRRDTSITHLILNCALFVVLSSALPLLVKILGITNFDLLGNFGRIRWLGNTVIILTVNIIFGTAAALSLFNKVTHRAQKEIWRRLSVFIYTIKENLLFKLGGKESVQSLPNAMSSTSPLISSPLRPLRIKSD